MQLAGDHRRRPRILWAAEIGRDAAGNPSGILEDAAQESGDQAVPAADAARGRQSRRRRRSMRLRRQGITTFLDAMAESPSLAGIRRRASATGSSRRARISPC